MNELYVNYISTVKMAANIWLLIPESSDHPGHNYVLNFDFTSFANDASEGFIDSNLTHGLGVVKRVIGCLTMAPEYEQADQTPLQFF